MVMEHWKTKEQRLLNEIEQLKKDKEELNLIIIEKNKDISVLKTNLEVNDAALKHNQVQVNQIISERNKIEQEYNNLLQVNKKLEIKVSDFKNASFTDRLFRYNKFYNND